MDITSAISPRLWPNSLLRWRWAIDGIAKAAQVRSFADGASLVLEEAMSTKKVRVKYRVKLQE